MRTFHTVEMLISSVLAIRLVDRPECHSAVKRLALSSPVISHGGRFPPRMRDYRPGFRFAWGFIGDLRRAASIQAHLCADHNPPCVADGNVVNTNRRNRGSEG